MNNLNSIRKFLLKHPVLFVNHLSGMYPLTESLIEKYKKYLDWDALSLNEDLPWTEDFFLKFKNYWSWRDPDIPYSPDIQSNPKLKMTPALIRKNMDKIDWEFLSQDTALLLHYPGLLDEHKERLFWDYISGNEKLVWSEELITRFEDKWHWQYLSGNRSVNWTSSLIKRYHDRIDMDRIMLGNDEPWLNTQSPVIKAGRTSNGKNLLDSNGTVDFDLLSMDENIEWTEGLIERHLDKWNWEGLSTNRALPWSVKLIEKYLERWEFGHSAYDNGEIVITPGLSDNEALNWSSALIKKFKNYWFWDSLSFNEGIPWTIDILNEFYDLWIWKNLTWNKALWEKVFYPHLNIQVIDELMGGIVNKKLI